MSVVSQVILTADDELRYPSSGELTNIKEFFRTGEQRMRIASILAENEKKIVQEASKQLWKKRPDFISPGGNAIGLVGVREMYNSLGVPVPGMVESIRCLKQASLALLSDEDAREASPYFDYIIQSMS